jgi:hypothetical protein
MTKNKHAQALARLGKGVKRKYSAVEIERRRIRLSNARLKRWVDKGTEKQVKE